MAYTKSLNEPAKVQLRLNGNIVTLSNQSGSFLKGIQEAQMAAEVPRHKVLHPMKTKVTRWGNQFGQLGVNNTIKLGIDTSLQTYKKANKGNKEAIVVANDSDQGSKVGKAVAELEGLRFESEELRQQVMTPRVYRHVEQVVGQKRQAGPAAGGGSALPAPITEDATLGQANGFLGGMCDSEIGQQIMGKAAATVLDGRYTPPQDRRA